MDKSPAKFCHVESGEDVPHDYGDVFFEQPCGSSTRLVIGPSSGHIDLLTQMAAELRGNPWFILYVLLVPRVGNRESGRYQSPPIETHTELASTLAAFTTFFEGDGRHHVWVGSGQNDGTLVYDHHNVIFGYGPLDRFARILRRQGFQEREFWFPSPHSHSYLPENDAEEERLMSELDWRYFPLQDGDEW